MKNFIVIKLTPAIKVYPRTLYKQEKVTKMQSQILYKRKIIAAMIHESLPIHCDICN